jgi:thermostable 8-oxoguanine DNA glycosylase
MFDPANITKYDCTTEELEQRLLYGIAAAGKRATQVRESMACFLTAQHANETPFSLVRRLDDEANLRVHLERARLSPYTVREAGFRAASVLGDLTTTTIDDLDAVPGIGPKTARFFVVHTRPHARYAVLDVHILAWLADQGYANVPRSTPQHLPTYLHWEQIFLDECDQRGIEPAVLDIDIWRERSWRSPNVA